MEDDMAGDVSSDDLPSDVEEQDQPTAAQRLVAVLRDVPPDGIGPEDIDALKARLQQELDALEAVRREEPRKGQALHEALTKIAEQATTHTHQTGVLVPRAIGGLWTDPFRPDPGDGLVAGRTLEQEHFLARSDAKNSALHGVLTMDVPYREPDGSCGKARLLDVVARGGQTPGGFLAGLADVEVDTPSGRRAVGAVLRASLPAAGQTPTLRLDQHTLLYWPGEKGDTLLTPLTSVALFGELQALLGRSGPYWEMRGDTRKETAEVSYEYDLPSRPLNFSEKRWSNMGSGWPGSVGKGGGRCLRADLSLFERSRPLDRLSLDVWSRQVRRAFDRFHEALTSPRPDNQAARKAVEAALVRLFDEMASPISEADPQEGRAVSWLGRAARQEMREEEIAAAFQDFLSGIRRIQGEVSLTAATWEWIAEVLRGWLERRFRQEWSA